MLHFFYCIDLCRARSLCLPLALLSFLSFCMSFVFNPIFFRRFSKPKWIYIFCCIIKWPRSVWYSQNQTLRSIPSYLSVGFGSIALCTCFIYNKIITAFNTIIILIKSIIEIYFPSFVTHTHKLTFGFCIKFSFACVLFMLCFTTLTA